MKVQTIIENAEYTKQNTQTKVQKQETQNRIYKPYYINLNIQSKIHKLNFTPHKPQISINPKVTILIRRTKTI